MKPNKFNFFLTSALRAIALAPVISLSLTSISQGQSDLYWSGDVDANWNTDNSTDTNWSTTLGSNTNSTALPGTLDTAIFTMDGAANLNTTLGQDFTIDSLQFNTASTVTINTINTNPLLITGNAGIVVSQGNHVINGSALGSGNNPDVRIGSGAFAIDIAASSSLTFNARIRSNGSNDVYNKTGLGTLTLAANSGGGSSWGYSGGVFNINEGVVALSDDNASGNSGNSYSVAAGAALELRDANFSSSRGTLTINGSGIGGNGALRSISGNTAVLSNVDGSVVLASDSSIGVDAETLTIPQNITGGFGLTKVGAGTLVLSSAANTYTGATTLSSGTLQLTGGDNRLPTSSIIDFTGSSTLDLTDTTQTISSFTTPEYDSVNLTVTGAGGSLIINGNSDLQIGPGPGVTGDRVVAGMAATMDFSGLSSLTYNSPTKKFRVGLKSGSFSNNPGEIANVTLAASNTITADTLALGDLGGSNSGGLSTLKLGSTNFINVNTLNNGSSGRSNTIFGFASGLTDPTAMIRNTDGNSAVANWRVGNVATFSDSTWTDTVDLTDGTIDAKVTNLTIGSAQISTSSSRGGTENATFSMGKGTLEATTLTLGTIGGTKTDGVGSAKTLSANGTFNLDHADGVVKATTLRFSENTIASTSGTKSVSGTFNLLNGTLEAGSIELGSQTGGTATFSSNFNWTNGTIRNAASADLTIDSTPITLLSGTHTFEASGSNTITANSTSAISGSGGLEKTGSGTLRLNGANTYDGNTNVTAGTLALDSLASLGNTAINVSTGATLGGGGTINGTTTIQGTHAPGFSPGVQTFTNGLAYAASSTLQWEFSGNTLGVAGIDYDIVNVNGGDLTLTAGATLALLASGTDYSQSEWMSARDFTVIDFSGAGTSTGNFLLDTTGAGSFSSFGSWSSLNSADDIVLSWTPVPEPSSALLVGAMSALLLVRRRR